ncbi:MAG: hypothetical protein MK077_06800 [Phycisphaerales bacterium]|nr:hypothetical protein [Phycisphaerales bacterium]
MSCCSDQWQGGTTVDKRAGTWLAALVHCGAPMPTKPIKPLPVVVLRHDEPGGHQHWDVLIARSPNLDGAELERSGLIGFRVPSPPNQALPGMVLPIIWTPDHDRSWLTREGEVSGGRGFAWRVCSGDLHLVNAAVVQIDWHGGQQSQWRLGVQESKPALHIVA